MIYKTLFKPEQLFIKKLKINVLEKGDMWFIYTYVIIIISIRVK